MTQIQSEVARLQVMADDLFKLLPQSANASKMSCSVVPNLEAIRAKARRELDSPEGLSQETYDAVSNAMTDGENLGWDIVFKEVETYGERAAAKLLCRQFDNIHIMMNHTEGVPVPENHKCWPPDDPNCP